METLSSLRKRAALLEPTVRIGKKGLTPSLISEIDTRLSKQGLVKIKMLRASLYGSEEDSGEGADDGPHESFSTPSLSKEDIAQKIVAQTKSKLVSRVGMVLTIYREIPPKPLRKAPVSIPYRPF